MDNEQNQAMALVPSSTRSNGDTPTLLPKHIAQAVTLATRSTGMAIRVGSLISSLSIDAARFTTLSSLELARGVVESVLTRAGREVLHQSQSDLATADAESIIEKSLESLHFVVAQVVFWTSASFQLGGTTLSTATDISQLLLGSLDQLFGSTDSSRAIAGIITLIRREFQNPATGAPGEKIGVLDLIIALAAFAYLQQGCRKTVEEDRRRRAYEEVIWDVVVLSDGERVDVRHGLPGDDPEQSDAVLDDFGAGMGAIPPAGTTWQASGDEDAIIGYLKSQISNSLAPGTTVSITDSLSTTQTITVDISGRQAPSLPELPGAEVIETRPIPTSSTNDPNATDGSDSEPSYRVVYRIESNKLRQTSFKRDEDAMTGIIDLNTEDPQNALGLQTFPTPVSPATSTSSASSFVEVSFPKKNSVSTKKAVVQSPKSSTTKDSSQHQAKVTSPKQRVNAKLLATTTGQKVENTANQKRRRSSMEKKSGDRPPKPTPTLPPSKRLAVKKSEAATPVQEEKKTGLKQVLKGSTQSISNIWSRDSASTESINKTQATKSRPHWKFAGASPMPMPISSPPPIDSPSTKTLVLRGPNPAPARGITPRSLAQNPEHMPRSSSRASYVSLRDRRRDSIVSQSDPYAFGGGTGLRPGSPSFARVHETSFRPRSEVTPSLSVPPSPRRAHHRRAGSHVPSIYSLATNDSQTSLLLSSYYQKSAYNASNALDTLRREGVVAGTFPTGNLLQNITRYMRFSSASYGSSFLKFMGISKDMPTIGAGDNTHDDVRHFLHHTESGFNNILLASFVDPQGGSDSSGSTGTGVPLVHYISLDHGAKAVVLACRGTLGFEDVLADMTCDYDKLSWRGRGYRVHKGVHASAKRLLYGGDGRVLITLKEALSEFPDYGLVLCGHSLGGAVTALLGVMLSEPNPDGTGFVTARDTESSSSDGGQSSRAASEITLPHGRRIHVYAYGPPGTMSRSLSKITRGLITTVVHGHDLVPHLSLGLLHDFQAVALAFRGDQSQTKEDIRQHIWATLQQSITRRWNRTARRSPVDGEPQSMQPCLDSMRQAMKNEKLLPPGEVFTIETQRVLRRDAFLVDSEDHLGRPAHRILLKYVRDVETRFGEVKFGTSMLVDHSPGKYEEALNKLRLGVAD